MSVGGETVYSPCLDFPWFIRGGYADVNAGIFSTGYIDRSTATSSRLIITPWLLLLT
mgnify:CR=1 FL=1